RRLPRQRPHRRRQPEDLRGTFEAARALRARPLTVRWERPPRRDLRVGAASAHRDLRVGAAVQPRSSVGAASAPRLPALRRSPPGGGSYSATFTAARPPPRASAARDRKAPP